MVTNQWSIPDLLDTHELGIINHVEEIEMSNYANRYNTEFKRDAIRLVEDENRSVPSVSKDLGINAQTLRNWLNAEKRREKPESARILELEKELKAEKRRNAELEEAVAILKKATALFVTNNRK